MNYSVSISYIQKDYFFHNLLKYYFHTAERLIFFINTQYQFPTFGRLIIYKNEFRVKILQITNGRFNHENQTNFPI